MYRDTVHPSLTQLIHTQSQKTNNGPSIPSLSTSASGTFSLCFPSRDIYLKTGGPPWLPAQLAGRWWLKNWNSVWGKYWTEPTRVSRAGKNLLDEIQPSWMRSSLAWMRSLVVRAFDCQCRSRNSPGFDPSIFRHSGIWGAADKAVLNTVHRRKNQKNPPV